MHLQDRRILLTGASGGIGRALALALASRGAWLCLSGRDRDALARLKGEVEAHGGRAEIFAADLGADDGPERLAAHVLTAYPRLDVLINCAGTSHFGEFADTPAPVLSRLWQTNVLAPMRLVQALLPTMRAQGRGLIVNVGSIFGSIAFPCFTAYSSTKFALRGFSEALRRELNGSGIGVLYVAPRYTRTAINAGAVEAMAAAVKMPQDDPAAVAAQIVLAIERERAERYLGWPEKLFVRINAWFPRLVDRALRRQTEQMRPFALPRPT